MILLLLCGITITRNAAAIVQITSSVIIYQYSRVKQPCNAFCALVTPENQFAACRRFSEWSNWRITFQYSNTAAAVCKVHEKFIFSINLFICYRRSPGITCPFLSRCIWFYQVNNRDITMVCPVYHICGGYYTYGCNLAKTIILCRIAI